MCAIGNGAAQCSASFRAGLSGYMLSPVMRGPEPVRMALVPELELELLAPALDGEALTCRERRMLRLSGMALSQHSDFHGPLFLALPETRSAFGGSPIRTDFRELLSAQTGACFDQRTSQTFELGRAGGFFALKAALAALDRGIAEVLVGGVETFLDLRILAVLAQERRLLGDDVRDGFTPGEAAAFVRLGRKSAQRPTTVLRAVGTGHDPGHRYSEQPALGVGLSAALDDAQWRAARLPLVRTCFAGLNGESFGAKAWGVAHMRHHALFATELAFEHPADVYGDVGAATGPLLLALADETLRHDHRPGPALCWAASDDGPCGAAYLGLGD